MRSQFVRFERLSKLGIAFFAVSLLMYCGGKNDDDNTNENRESGGPPAFVGARTDGAYSLRMRFAASSGNAAGAGLNLLELPADFQFYNKSIASGAPDELTIYVKKISLSPVSGGLPTPIYISGDDEGTPLPVRSGAVDISSMFTKIDCVDFEGNVVDTGGLPCDCGISADGTVIAKVPSADDPTTEICPAPAEGDAPPIATMTVDTVGPFKGIELQLASNVTGKGCVSGTFDSVYSITGEQTYCTRTDYDYKTVTNSNSWAATEFQAPLASVGTTINMAFGTQGSENLIYNFSSPLTLSDAATPQLTLLLDLNRVLRFNNGGFQASASNPVDQECRPIGSDTSGLPCGPLFYPLRPAEFMYVFVGEPGRIEGYSWLTRAKDDEDAVPIGTTPTDFACEGENNCIDIAGWMTVVYAPGATKPFFLSLSPDDDNALTVVKGSNMVFEQNAVGSFEPKVDATKITAGETAETLNLGYSLGQELSGVIKNFTPQTAVNSSLVGGAHFEIERNNMLQYGEIYFKREL